MNSSPSIGISVVIAVYRAERILTLLCERLVNVLKDYSEDYEIVFVDDRSPDGSWLVLKSLAARFTQVTAIRFARNFGQHFAITAGLDIARGEWVVVMDCDLQDEPEDIPRLLECAKEGYEIVLARRTTRHDARYKQVASKTYYKIFSLLSSLPLDPSVGTFRVMHRRVVEAFRRMPERFRLFGGMVYWLGFTTGYIDVHHAPRYDGASSYDVCRLLKLGVDGIISFSNRPLYFNIGLGIVMSISSVAVGLYALIHYVFFGPFGVPGWFSTITVSAFVGGLILLNLGIIGIYIGRIYDECKGRPLYVIDTVLFHGDGYPNLRQADAVITSPPIQEDH